MTSPRYLPPAVRFPVYRPPGVLALGLLVWAASAALLWAWRANSGPVSGWVPWAGWVLWLAAGAALLYSWHVAPQGHLWWDGGAWWWRRLGQDWLALTEVQVRMDAQTVMWLGWRSPQGRHQAWVAQGSDPVRWGDWRRAVYSTATVSRMAGNRA